MKEDEISTDATFLIEPSTWNRWMFIISSFDILPIMAKTSCRIIEFLEKTKECRSLMLEFVSESTLALDMKKRKTLAENAV